MLPKGLLREYSGLISMMLRLMDITAICGAGWVAYFLRFGDDAMPSIYLIPLLIAFGLTPLVFRAFNIYAPVRGLTFSSHLASLFQAMGVIAIVLAGLSFLTKSGETFSRLWFGIWMVIALLLVILCRVSLLLLLHYMRSKGLNERRVVILGAGTLGSKFAQSVQQALWTGFRIVSFFDDNVDNKPSRINAIPVIKTPEHLTEYLHKHAIDEIWIALPLNAVSRVKEVLLHLRASTVNTRFVLDLFGLDFLNHSLTDIAGFPVLNLRQTPMVGINRLIKAFEDRIIASIILIIISPLLLMIAIGVKLTSKGPIFFKQDRLGWDGRIFKIYKFRTMYVHQEKQGRVTQATFNDQRVTRFGRFLRKTSLDELPQFFNVLQGRMSIVGPRPHALAHNEEYKHTIHTYMQRHRVKPGITGWAQVNGWRGETDTLIKMQKRVDYDLYYIDNWSLWFDIKIILLTFINGFINRNAY